MKSLIHLTVTLLPLTSALPVDAKQGDVLQDEYIVTLKPSVKPPAISGHLNWVEKVHERSLEVRGWPWDDLEDDGDLQGRGYLKGRGKGKGRKHRGVDKVWKGNFKGYSGQFSKAAIAEIADSDDVIAVEPVRVVKTCATVTQSSAPWGLGSISHRTPNWDKYLYDETAGNGTWGYVVDTGLYTEHQEFEGRASLGYNAMKGTNFTDYQGHGTHTAGTIASRAYGVAKKAKVISVRVFDKGSSTTAIVIDGYEWAVNNITASNRVSKSVISMSIGGGLSAAFNAAIDNAFKAGILTVVAAGNNNADARNYSPGSAASAITVGAVAKDNSRAGFSNFGVAVDIWATGVDVRSTWIGNRGASAWLSGTSMACPHVAGMALYLMGLGNATLSSPGAVASRIKELGTAGVLTNGGVGSPNLLAYNGIV